MHYVLRMRVGHHRRLAALLRAAMPAESVAFLLCRRAPSARGVVFLVDDVIDVEPAQGEPDVVPGYWWQVDVAGEGQNTHPILDLESVKEEEAILPTAQRNNTVVARTGVVARRLQACLKVLAIPTGVRLRCPAGRGRPACGTHPRRIEIGTRSRFRQQAFFAFSHGVSPLLR